MFVKSTTYGKIETGRKSVTSTFSTLTNSNNRGIKMAKSNLPNNLSVIKKPTRKDFIDFEGQKVGMLTVIGYVGRIKNHTAWLCLCECGNTATAFSTNLSDSKRTQSCGCYRKIHTIRHGETSGHKMSPEYNSYSSAKRRCQNPKNPKYYLYGGRGIEFRFDCFEDFLAEVGRRPSPIHTLDRKDVNSHYDIGNVQWATPTEQARNRQQNRFIEIDGVSKCLAEWCEVSPITPSGILFRLKNNYCPKCAVFNEKSQPCEHKGRSMAVYQGKI